MHSILLKRPPFVVSLIVAVLASASTWFYMNRILRAEQVADAAAHNRPRGNLSDLYPRWLGARELLMHGRNPYSADITREIQQGYYGRPLDPARPTIRRISKDSPIRLMLCFCSHQRWACHLTQCRLDSAGCCSVWQG